MCECVFDCPIAGTAAGEICESVGGVGSECELHAR